MSHITRLQAENFKKLTVIDVQPGTTAGVVPIRGRNAQGKSSTLDAIMAALGGAKHMPSRPVRKGEEEGAIRLTLDTGEVILRRFSADGRDSIEVTNGEGFKAGSPQALLNRLYASVAFDPLAFTRLKPAEQLENLRKLVKLDVDVDALGRANDADYAARRDKNRELSSESGRLERMATYPDAPREKVDELTLEGSIAQASDHNAQIERRRANREQFTAAIERNRQAAAQDRREAAALVERAEEFERQVAADEEKLAAAEPLPDAIDVTEVQAQLRTARTTNAQVEANHQHAVQERLVKTLQGESDALTERMDERKAAITASIGRAEMPVPGLGFGESEVLFGGVPLDQASSAEQLRVSTAIGIASAPKLRVMLVRDGSLLDDDGQRILADLAAQHDFQLWVEAVDATGAVGIVLEDGAVVAVDGQPAPEPEQIGRARRRAKKAEEPVQHVEDGMPTPTAQEIAAADTDQEEDETLAHPLGDEADYRYDERRADEDRMADERTPAEVDRVPTRAASPAPVSLFD